MTAGRDRGEDAFFSGAVTEPRAAPLPPPPRRESPLLRRSPLLAAVALAVSGWLLAMLWPDVAYFLSPGDPIDLGGPGAYRLDAARENRLAQIRGELLDAVPVTETRSGAARTVGRLAGTNLIVDRPGRGGPPVFEGRLLPAAARADYGEVVAAMRSRGGQVGDRFLVLRDGERPRKRWPPVAGAAILLVVVAVNGRALLRRLLTR
ncbi:hypothetical protein [Anaeromyxobacter oryzae]|uniref:Uncharacterized protein n=1 Tax=Anaeromyxobacter oryzae TaxID=2918170 RepID=A0ABN6MZT6_9BACT|nr:hypothetical protein [Anaeromyxobacter oryzae]BDG06181.1 hypothetical protein AMOR_51770 [Anaeromyxobacter oryzae]